LLLDDTDLLGRVGMRKSRWMMDRQRERMDGNISRGVKVDSRSARSNGVDRKNVTS